MSLFKEKAKEFMESFEKLFSKYKVSDEETVKFFKVLLYLTFMEGYSQGRDDVENE